MKNNTSYYVSRALAGETEAFSVLYRMTFRRIYYICINLLKNPHDTDDVVQEIYLSAYRNLAGLYDKSKFSVWLERIAVNKCMDFLRRKTPLPFDEPEISENIPDADNDIMPEQYIINSEKHRIIMEIMRRNLSDLQYRTLFLYYFNDLTVREISLIMDCSEGAVKNRLSTARSKIKSAVEKYQDDTGDKLYAMPLLAVLFEEEAENIHIPDLKNSAVKSVSIKTGKAGLKMIKLKIIAGTAVVLTATGGTAIYFNGAGRTVPQQTSVYEYSEVSEEVQDNQEINLTVTETLPVITSAFAVTETSVTVADTVTTTTTMSSAVSENTAVTVAELPEVTEIQTVTEEVIPEIITESPETTINEEPSRTLTESVPEYSISDEIDSYQERFFEYVRVFNESTNGMIEMCRGMDISEHFEGEERERFLELSALADEYDRKIYEFSGETEALVQSLENNPYYDLYVRAEEDLVKNNYGAPEGAYVGAVQQWYALNENYKKLTEYLYSEINDKFPEDDYIRQYETEWAEKHEYFLNNVIIYNGDWSNPSTGEFEVQSRKYHCLMLMLYLSENFEK